MMTAVIVNTSSKRIAEHNCNSWEQCMEWINSYLTYNDLKRACSDHIAHGVHTVWVKDADHA